MINSLIDQQRRILACLNACGDIPIECLETGAFETLLFSLSEAMREAQWDDWSGPPAWYVRAKKAIHTLDKTSTK